MNDNAPIPNPLLRAHATDHAFVLTLRKSHIWALEIIGRNLPSPCTGQWVGPVKGLEARGLVEHGGSGGFAISYFPGTDAYGMKRRRTSDHWRLTRAGWAAYDLLAEAGLVPPLERASPQRKLVA